jgi:hypothetical protein
MLLINYPKKKICHFTPSLNPSDSAEPFGPGLTAEGLVAGRQGREVCNPHLRFNRTPPS